MQPFSQGTPQGPEVWSKPVYDLVVVGGGINGCGIARDAAGRGLRVLLLEKGDLAGETSSASTKLIHGGLRYLEHYDFMLVRKALKERERLWAAAPHIIWPLRFVLPHHEGLRPKWLLRLGLALYDHLGGRKRLPATAKRSLSSGTLKGILKSRFRTGYEYSDCWVDDARLVVACALDAAENSAQIVTGACVTNLERAQDGWHVRGHYRNRAAKSPTGQPFVVRAVAVVNAAGCHVDVIDALVSTHAGDLDSLGPDGKSAHKAGSNAATRDAAIRGTAQAPSLRLVRGSHIIVPRLYEAEQAFIFQNADGRIVFAIPYEEAFTLIGTTDAPHEKPHSKSGTATVTSQSEQQDTGFSLGEVAPSEAEVAYLIGAVNGYFERQISTDDIVWRYAGVRALYDDHAGDAASVTRDYRLILDTGPNGTSPALLSIYGGKITTFRTLAESAVDLLAPLFPHIEGADTPWTEAAPLPGYQLTKDVCGNADAANAGLQGQGGARQMSSEISPEISPEISLGAVGETLPHALDHPGHAGLRSQLSEQYPWLGVFDAARLVRLYGSRSIKLMEGAQTVADMGRLFGGRLSEREVDFLITQEWASQASDILWRRTKAGLYMSAAERADFTAWFDSVKRPH